MVKKTEDNFEVIDIAKLKEKVDHLEEENTRLQLENKKLMTKLEVLRNPPFMFGTVISKLKDGKFLVKTSNGVIFAVSSILDDVFPGDNVLLHQTTLTILEKVETLDDQFINSLEVIDKPKISFDQIGGLKKQIEEIKEVVDLPFKYPERFKKLGISPPKGVLLYGPPGTGKTLLAKAVASDCNVSFIRVSASELVQKFIGEGAKTVKKLFAFARKKAPCIVFIDEIDAIGTKRVEDTTGGEKEVNRTMIQLLSEMDGFDPLDNVKVIAATNRVDILDPALLRPGRFDRLIEVPLPNKEGRKEIFKIYLSKMNVNGKIDFDKLAEITKDMSGAEIKAICTESGYFAIREGKDYITMDHLLKAVDKLKKEDRKETVEIIKYI